MVVLGMRGEESKAPQGPKHLNNLVFDVE